jgi:hypothetical protein
MLVKTTYRNIPRELIRVKICLIRRRYKSVKVFLGMKTEHGDRCIRRRRRRGGKHKHSRSTSKSGEIKGPRTLDLKLLRKFSALIALKASGDRGPEDFPGRGCDFKSQSQFGRASIHVSESGIWEVLTLYLFQDQCAISKEEIYDCIVLFIVKVKTVQVGRNLRHQLGKNLSMFTFLNRLVPTHTVRQMYTPTLTSA